MSTAVPVPGERAVPPGRAPIDGGGTAAAPGPRPRVAGVDIARGLALVGMAATHVFDSLDDDGRPGLVHVVAGGRAATTFVLLAGVSLAFLSGGRRGVRGRERVSASAGLAVRAALIGVIGLVLGHLGAANGIDGILPFYALLFLLAIPLLGAPVPVLLGVAAAAIALGPLLLVATAGAELPFAEPGGEPTLAMLVRDPGGLLALLLLTGEYPVVVYLAYLCAGMAIGRLDLRSPRLAWVLLLGGAALAATARVASAVLLNPMGGLRRLIEQDDRDDDPAAVSELLWSPERSSSWDYLAIPAPHSHTTVDVLHTLGSAAAVLGAALLLSRVPAVIKALSPLAAAGAMSLTLYSGHLVLLATGILDDRPGLLFVGMVVGGLALAWVWRRRFGRGPLEALVTSASAAARRAGDRRAAPADPG
ncbi:heparan-alpha-glucosaminide N-acetyltransferase domain-containing protein [Pseudonocardia humida]|uniref:DUF1624 domain-containing protein n=1 Tax=Pseudonocardia humida TaxID=2800819 RepID=A0ABT1A3Y8_9PSEU|nr:heparan-alpha-glucosaminide N-acetyltransferase domain-containing protein [Pseudonocardia humida]MCO1657712.1 DUF1624 domain-containing protein [Pseudonocardia humida]